MNSHPVHPAYVDVLTMPGSDYHPYVVCMWRGLLDNIKAGWTSYTLRGNAICLDNDSGDGYTVRYELDPEYPDIAIRVRPAASVEERNKAKELGAPWLQYRAIDFGYNLQDLANLKGGHADAASAAKKFTGKPYVYGAQDETASIERRILNQAADAITGDRAESYGPAEDSFETLAQLWNTYAGTDLDAEDVAMMLVLMKVARQMYKHKDDNLIDIAGYAALAARIHDKADGSE